MKNKELIILTGPTAVGKTKLSIALAKAIDGEIISADSMQVYQGMDIGTAKITKEEMDGVRHHLIDCIRPDEEFNVAVFQRLAREAIKEIESRKHIPILVGGTAFYIQALLYGIDFTEEEHDQSYREGLMLLAETEEGKKQLYERLKKEDLAYADTLHYNNVKRVVRALEYQHFTGKKFSDYNEEQRSREAQYAFCYFVLTDRRERIYQRIDERVDVMIQNGLLDEVKQLQGMGYARSLVSMQGIGYKEILSYLSGECSFMEAVETIKKDTRHFAKRQMTWFRREKAVTFLDKDSFCDNEKKILDVMLTEIWRKSEK